MLGGVGALIATNDKYKSFFVRYRPVLKFATLLACVYIIIYCSTIGLDEMAGGMLGYFNAYVLIPCIGLIVLGFAIINNTQNVVKTKRNKILNTLEYLGLLSYGIYLFHMPIYELGRDIVNGMHLTLTDECLTLFVLIGTIAFSHLTYRYVERPFLRLR